MFPEDGLVKTVENVFSFDAYDDSLLDHLTAIFHKYEGLPSAVPISLPNHPSV